MNTKEKKYEKILFRLKRDSEGYPPDDWESLWAFETESGLYSIDNIPFFVRGISLGDVVSVKKKNDELFFNQVKKFSDHSVIRIVVFEKQNIKTLKKKLSELGCDSGEIHLEDLIAFDVPPESNFQEITAFLQEGEDANKWEYEEASIRHKTN